MGVETVIAGRPLEAVQRLRQTSVRLSNVGHIYTALGVLAGRTLVQEIPGTRAGRQPKPHYRATPLGISEYRDWLIGQLGEDRRRNQMFVLCAWRLDGAPKK